MKLRLLLFVSAVITAALVLAQPAPTAAQKDTPESHPPKEQPDYVVISADDLLPAAREWANYRESRGRKVKLFKLADIATNWGHARATLTDIRNTIKGAAGETISDEFQVLLVGDCPPSPKKRPEGEQDYNPKVEIPWFISDLRDEQGDLIAGDNFYADLVDKKDDLPEIAVGRIPARSVEEVRAALAKVKDYEAAKFGEWVKRLTFFAGEGHYGAMIDAMIEQAFIQFADEHIDNAYDLRMTYANLASPYAWVPGKFSDKVIDEANMGALMLTYLGHGSPDRLDDMRVKIGKTTKLYPILTGDDVAKFDIKDGKLPIMLIIACDTGWLDRDQPCLAEKILFRKNAPVAVVASSRNSHPYSNMVVQKGMIQGVANKRCKTLGETFLYMKRELIEANEPDRVQLELMASMLMPKKADRDAQNQAHLFLYNLIGDPGLKIKHPDVAATPVLPPPGATPGDKLEFSFEFKPGLPARPAAGSGDANSPQVEVSLHVRRGQLAAAPVKLEIADLLGADEEKREAAEKAMQENHALANSKLVMLGNVTALNFNAEACIEAEIAISTKDTLAPGDYLIKIFALDAKGEHCGFAAIPLKVVKKE